MGNIGLRNVAVSLLCKSFRKQKTCYNVLQTLGSGKNRCATIVFDARLFQTLSQAQMMLFLMLMLMLVVLRDGRCRSCRCWFLPLFGFFAAGCTYVVVRKIRSASRSLVHPLVRQC
jgi:hypothetical protein